MRHRSRIIPVISLIPAACAMFTAACGDRAAPSPPAQRTVSSNDVDAAVAAAQKALDDGRIDDAVRLAAFAATSRDAAATHELHGRALLALASRAEGRRTDATATRKAAAQAYRRAAELDAANAPLQHAAAMVLDSALDAGAAMSFYDRALALSPDNTEYLVHRGNARIRTGDIEGADVDAARLASIAPDEPWTYVLRAQVALARGDANAAVASAAKATTLAPQSSEFRMVLARSLREAGRAKDAVELLAALPPDERAENQIAEQLAAAWTVLGRHDKAAETWELAHAAHPDDLRSAVEAARAKLKHGDRLAARSMLDEAKRIAKDDADVAAIERELSAANDRRPSESSRP